MSTAALHTVPTPPQTRPGHGGSSLGMSHPFLNLVHWNPWHIHGEHTQCCSPRGLEKSHDCLCSAHMNRALKGADFGIHHFKHNHLNLSKTDKTLMEQSSSSRLLLQEPQILPSHPTHSRPYKFLLTSDHPRRTKKLQLFCTTEKHDPSFKQDYTPV